MRWLTGAGLLVVLTTTSACTGGSGHSSAPVAAPASPPGNQVLRLAGTQGPGGHQVRPHHGRHQGPPPQANARALKGHGELAVIADQRLWLVGGPVHHLKAVRLPGVPSAPAWSHDGRWLAVTVKPADGHSVEWLLSARGRVVTRLGRVYHYGVDASWSPTADRLLWHTGSRAFVGGVRGPIRRVISGSAAWSPDGRHIAAVVGSRGRTHISRLVVLPAMGGRGRTVATLRSKRGDSYILAGWWPDGSGLLAWDDYDSSGSIAADGLPLFEVPLDHGRPHRIAKSMLVHRSWIATSAKRNQIAIIDGGNRELTLGHKALAICTKTRCRRLPQPRHEVSFDPAWSAGGQLIVVRDRAIRPREFGTPYIDRVQRSGGIERVAGATATAIPGLATNATSPLAGRHGELLARRGRSLVLLTRAGETRKVIGPLLPRLRSSYYGFVPWLGTVAWTDARPGGLAGPD